MKLHLRWTLMFLLIICSIAVALVCFLPTFIVGLSGVNFVTEKLQRSIQLQISTKLEDFIASVQIENDKFESLFNRSVFGYKSSTAENYLQLKNTLCGILAALPYTTPFVQYATQTEGYMFACQRTINYTTYEVIDWAINVRNSTNMSYVLGYHVNPVTLEEYRPEYGYYEGYDPRNRGWYKNLSVARGWTDPYVYSQGFPTAITAGLPLYDRTTGALHGVFAVDILIDSLSDFLSTVIRDHGGAAMLINAKTNEVIGLGPTENIFIKLLGGSGGTDWITQLKKAEEVENSLMAKAVRNLGGNTGAVMLHPTGDREVDGLWITLHDVKDNFGLEWRLVLVLEKDYYLGSLLQQRLLVLILVPILIVMITVFQTSVGQSVASSLSTVTSRMEKLKYLIADMHEGESHGFALAKSADGVLMAWEDENKEKDDGDINQNDDDDTTTKSYSLVKEVAEVEEQFDRMSVTIRSFARYVPREVVCDLLQKGNLAEVKMHPAYCSIMFCDLENFTRISERVDTVTVATMMQIFFDTTTKCIHDHGGSVDKYIGDCTMAVWGAPMKADYQNVRVCSCALTIKRLVEHQSMQAVFAPSGRTASIRIGAHTGTVLAGNIGGQNRLNYTLVGSAVNLAARLEPLNKVFGTRIIISDQMRQDVHRMFVTRLLHRVQTSGFGFPSYVYELVGVQPDCPISAMGEVMPHHDPGSPRTPPQEVVELQDLEELTDSTEVIQQARAVLSTPIPGQSRQTTVHAIPHWAQSLVLDAEQGVTGGARNWSTDFKLRAEVKDIEEILLQATANLPRATVDEAHYCSLYSAAVHLYVRGVFELAETVLDSSVEFLRGVPLGKGHAALRVDILEQKKRQKEGGTLGTWDGFLNVGK